MDKVVFWHICPDSEDYKIMYRDFEDGLDKNTFVNIDLPFLNCMSAIRKDSEKILDKYEYIVIISARVYEKTGNILISFLRERINNVKVTLFMVDILNSYKFCIDDARYMFDQIFTYDQRDAISNDIKFCREPFSNLRRTFSYEKYDLSYIGHAKNRMDLVIDIYDAAIKHGLNCKFYLYGVPKEKANDNRNIAYNEYLSFEKILEIVNDSKCVLEVLTDDMYSPTSRYAEAYLLKKNLLSNSEEFKNNRYKTIVYFDKVSDINWDGVTKKSEWEMENIFEVKRLKKAIYRGIV